MNEKKLKYFVLHKPYGFLSQFTDKLYRKTLSHIKNIPKEVYPIGRLDMDSEGLLLLSNDKLLVDYLLNPNNSHEKEYLAQVEGVPTEEEMNKFRKGLLIENKITLPAKIEVVVPRNIPERVPPIRIRMNIPVCWLKIVITEGRNRQVRKMTAAIGHPTLRLIRTRIKNISLDELKTGEIRELTEIEIKDLKNYSNPLLH
jgi:23S rRNA pseudouridine2457 synthase